MSAPLRIMHVASEVMPFIKSGGLADVAGALPRALARAGCDVAVVLPAYNRARHVAWEIGLEWLPSDMVIEAGGVEHRIGVGLVVIEDVRYYLIACDELFGRDGIYGPSSSVAYEDNARRFSVFCKAALALTGLINWKPHVVHAHDWPAGLVPALLERGWANDLPATRSVFSIHNIAYQGSFWHWDIKLTGLDWSLFNTQQFEHNGRLSFLKGGIVFADRVTTVSRRYAEEIQQAEFGFGLDGVLRLHKYKLSGITNGIDVNEWNPATDPHLPANYDARNLNGKQTCKAELQRELGLPVTDEKCLVGVVSRLVWQKGIDLIAEVVTPYVLDGRMQLVVLGSGESHLEWTLRNLQGRHPHDVCFWHGYNEGLSHRIEAGSDIFLMPSRFEPCGLNQMYSLRYGTLPLVRYTGGLADTVLDVAEGEGNGFSFGPMDHGHFSSALDRALGLWRHYPNQWKLAMGRAMRTDFSWDHAAKDYIELYRSISMA